MRGIKQIIFISFVLSLTNCSSNGKNDVVDDTNNQFNSSQSSNNSLVIICLSEDAYAYHEHECRGLERCDASTQEVTLEEAQENGRKPCGFCY